MADKFKTIRVEEERRTWIKGFLVAKCKSTKKADSNSSDYRTEFGLSKVLDAQLTIEVSSESINEQQKANEALHNTGHSYNGLNFPTSLEVRAVSDGKYYTLNLHGLRFVQEPKISKISKGTNHSYATYEGMIVGYLVDTIIVEKEVLVAEPKAKQSRKKRRPVRKNGKDGCGSGCLNGIRYFISFLFLMYLLGATIYYLGIQVVFVVLAAILLYYLITATQKVFKLVEFVLPLAKGVFIVGFAIFLVLNIFKKSESDTQQNWWDTEKEETTEELIQLDSLTSPDTLIVNHRKWRDYEGNWYEADLKINKSKIKAAHDAKQELPYLLRMLGFRGIYQVMVADTGKQRHSFEYIYAEMDRLKKKHELDSVEFAKMIVSMVQDIPYVLVLSTDCDWTLYADDDFAYDYLRDNRPCDPNVTFGINSPEEFLSNLNGDCDTRTVTVYKMLSHYGYDVRVLNSDEFRHSILGINLRGLSGKFFVLDNKAYYTWETTAYGAQPGRYYPDLINQSLWVTTLK